MTFAKRRAVFFDRDGTLNEEVGYVDDMALFRIYPFAADAVRKINEAGLLAIVVTNQSGVARGLFSTELVERVHGRLVRELRDAGSRLDAIYYCPHHPEAEDPAYRQTCSCRKPETGMLQDAAAKFGIELQRSFVIGDRYLDVELAHRVGAASILVLTGAGRQEWEAWQEHGERSGLKQPEHVAENVSAAVQWVLQQVGCGQPMD